MEAKHRKMIAGGSPTDPLEKELQALMKGIRGGDRANMFNQRYVLALGLYTLAKGVDDPTQEVTDLACPTGKRAQDEETQDVEESGNELTELSGSGDMEESGSDDMEGFESDDMES